MALVLIPQAMAYARVAGLPAYTGLYAAALPPLAAAFFASSPYLQTGPAAVTSILTAGALATLAVQGAPEYIGLAALLALLVGLARVAIGLLRGGEIVYLMSEPVLRGFTVAAAILILASQVPGALGIPGSEAGLGAAAAALAAPSRWNPAAALFAAGTLALVLGARRVHPLIPGVLVATVGGVLLSTLLGYAGPVVGDVPEGLPRLSLDLPWRATAELLIPAGVIALLGFSEAASIARTYAARERQRWDPDREFVSQGVANLAAGISGGFPVGGSFSRSGLAHMLGARSRWAGAVTGATVLVFLPFAAVLAPLPGAVLSAMVIAAVAGLVRLGPLLSLWRVSRPQFLVAAATFTLTLALSPRIDQAVLLGILLAVVVHLWREITVVVDHWTEGDVLHVRVHGVLWFGSAEALKNRLVDILADHPTAGRVVLHVERLGRVDLTGALAIEMLVSEQAAAGVEVAVEGAHPEKAKVLRRVLPPRPAPTPPPPEAVNAPPPAPPEQAGTPPQRPA